MSTKTIAFLNIKGGVAKTATVTTVAHMLATIYDKKVLIVDLDAQANTTSMYCPMDENIAERIRRILNNEIYAMENSIATLMSDPNKNIYDCIRHTEYSNLDIIPSDLQLTTTENVLKADTMMPQQFRLKAHLQQLKGEYDYILLDCSPSVGLINQLTTTENVLKADTMMPQQFRLKAHLQQLKGEYDYILLDCSPSVGLININGLAAADEVYIPIRADANSIEGLAMAKNLVQTVSTYNPKLKLVGCFFIAWENNLACQFLYDLLEELIPEYLLPIKVGKSKFLSENTILQKPLYELDHGKNKSKATVAYLELTEYILNSEK